MSSTISFTPWPESQQQLYRDKGYWLDLPLTTILTDSAQQYPQNIAMICGQRQYSYTEFDQITNQLANGLINRGLGGPNKAQTALVQLPNCAEFYLMFFALLKAGIVPVNALFNHQSKELCAFAEQIKPDLVVLSCDHNQVMTTQGKQQLLENLTPHLANKNNILWFDQVFKWHDEQLLCYQDRSNQKLAPTVASEVALFQLSGGSTGTPKLIPRTHNDYDYSIRRSAEVCGLTPETVFLMALPAGHNFSLSSPGALGVWHSGGTVVISTDPSPASCFPLIDKHKVTMAALVPAALNLWLQASDNNQLSSLNLVQVGGAKLSHDVAARVRPQLGCQLQQVFGMAEGLVNYTRLDDDDGLICQSQGRPMSEADEVEVRDENGQVVAQGQIGELWTRGPYTFRGYYQRANQPNSKASHDQQGFYASGDLVRQLADGYLEVVGRVKDQVNRGGEKIDAQEVEDVLHQIEQIQQVAIVAKPCEQLGERAVAFIVSKTPIRAVQLRRHLRAQGLAEYKFPDKFEFIEQMPYTAVGKIDKRALRQKLQQLNKQITETSKNR